MDLNAKKIIKLIKEIKNSCVEDFRSATRAVADKTRGYVIRKFTLLLKSALVPSTEKI
jgi:hypothetical protein